MEVKKELPAIFEDFAEARRNAFLSVKEIKEKGTPVVGVFCTFMPEEIPMAMGAVPIGLCSFSEETIPEAEKDLPKNLCPLIKASYGFAKTDKCPFFYFSDLVVGESTCDGKKKMYEYLSEFKPVHIMELPNSATGKSGFEMWKKEIISYKEKLEEFFGVTITEEQLREAVKLKNRERDVRKEFYSLGKLKPSPIQGSKVHNTLYGAGFKFDKEENIKEMKALIEQIKNEYVPNEEDAKKPRILITGSPIGGVSAKIFKAIEENGGCVVALENCGGAKAIEENVDENAEDIYEAIARKYLNIGCACISPNSKRLELLSKMIDEYQVDGVLDVILTSCHPYNVETLKIKKLTENEKNISYMTIETDYSQSDAGQINTRIAAFIEILK